jgi:hypothetical protein
MPDPTVTDPFAPASPLDAATVLEDAADLLLIRGVGRGRLGIPGGQRCVLGALSEVTGDSVDAHMALIRRVGSVPTWNDSTPDDFEIVDTLRHLAKDLRNGDIGDAGAHDATSAEAGQAHG